MRILIIVNLVFCTLVAGCIFSTPTPVETLVVTSTHKPTPASTPQQVTPATAGIAVEAREYLTEALDIMQQNSLLREEIDWEDLREQALAMAFKAIEPSDTYPAIEVALHLLGDNHSFFLRPSEVRWMMEATPRPDLKPQTSIIEGRIAYISVAAVSGYGSESNAYATLYHEAIFELASADPCAWIVDLRENYGGNMWPMLAGVGPILGEGQVGAFSFLDGKKVFWYYTDGNARTDEEVLIELENPYELGEHLPLVAVLTGKATGSSGEAIVTAFRGRPNTRSFGEETYGLSTGNQDFTLSDGAVILLTVATFVDRDGREYGEQIVPDEIVFEDPLGKADFPLESATDWLLSHPNCEGAGGDDDN